MLRRGAEREAKALAIWGVSYAEANAAHVDGTAQAYRRQQKNAANRGITWELTIPQWLAVWQESGKMHLRGRGKGRYVMSRMNDEGAYRVGNVYIQLSTQNNRDGIAKARNTKVKHTGVMLLYPGRAKPWAAYARNSILGLYAAEEEAVAAREQYVADHPGMRQPKRGYSVRTSSSGARYQVQVGKKYIGTYASPEQALAARQQALQGA